jgi:branched-chain amino acid transport system permease protein
LEFLVIQTLNGLSYGLLLFLLSAGLTLIFSMMGVLNFAHASFYMVGAYFGYQITRWIGFWPGVVLAPLLVGIIGMLVERYGLRAVHKHGHVAELLFTFGLAYLIEEAVHLIWGRAAVDYSVPASLDGALFTLFGSSFPLYRAFMAATAIAMLGAIYLVLTRTRTGLVIQAALSHPQMVEALGHNVPRVFMLTFGGGSALAGLAGAVGGPAFVTDPGMAAAIGPIVFVIVVVGGLGSLAGAFIASVLIGLLQTFSVALNWSLAGLLDIAAPADTFLGEVLNLTLAQAAPMLPYLIMVLMLIVRPRGLMGTRET